MSTNCLLSLRSSTIFDCEGIFFVRSPLFSPLFLGSSLISLCGVSGSASTILASWCGVSYCNWSHRCLLVPIESPVDNRVTFSSGIQLVFLSRWGRTEPPVASRVIMCSKIILLKYVAKRILVCTYF